MKVKGKISGFVGGKGIDPATSGTFLFQSEKIENALAFEDNTKIIFNS